MLNKVGKEIMEKLEEQYGFEKGRKIFFMMEHRHPEWIKGHK